MDNGNARYWAQNLPDRFWARVDRRGPDECWPWLGWRSKYGYGRLMVNKAWRQAHAVAWELANGRPIQGWALHRCDVRFCCNPDHVYEGDALLNSQDAHLRGRYATGARTRPEKRARGEQNGNAKVTADKVRAIRARYAKGGISQRELGELHGVHQTKISAIVRRKTWAHVLDEG